MFSFLKKLFSKKPTTVLEKSQDSAFNHRPIPLEVDNKKESVGTVQEVHTNPVVNLNILNGICLPLELKFGAPGSIGEVHTYSDDKMSVRFERVKHIPKAHVSTGTWDKFKFQVTQLIPQEKSDRYKELTMVGDIVMHTHVKRDEPWSYMTVSFSSVEFTEDCLGDPVVETPVYANMATVTYRGVKIHCPFKDANQTVYRDFISICNVNANEGLLMLQELYPD